MSRLVAFTVLCYATAACSSDAKPSSTSTLRSTSTAPAPTTTTTVLNTLTAERLGVGWEATAVADIAAVDDVRRQRCPQWKPPRDRDPAVQRRRRTFRRSQGPLPLVVVDDFRFVNSEAALSDAEAHADATFANCLRSTFEGAPLSAHDVTLEALKPAALEGAQLGYRVSGISGDGLETEHVVAETLIIVRGERVAVLTMSSSLRFPLHAATRTAAIKTLTAIR